MAKEDINKLLKELKEEQRVTTSLKIKPSIRDKFKVEAVKVAQKFGIHKSLVEKYYNQFGMMIESDFDRIFRFYTKLNRGSFFSSQP